MRDHFRPRVFPFFTRGWPVMAWIGSEWCQIVSPEKRSSIYTSNARRATLACRQMSNNDSPIAPCLASPNYLRENKLKKKRMGCFFYHCKCNTTAPFVNCQTKQATICKNRTLISSQIYWQWKSIVTRWLNIFFWQLSSHKNSAALTT